MLFQFYLEHDTLGSLQINEPDGFADLKLTLERDKNFKSLIERFEGAFIFYGDNGVVNGGIDRILEVERDYGPDAKLIFRARVSFDGYTFDDLFEGLLNLFGIIEMPNNKIQVPVIPNDFWTKFINRLDTPVDIQSTLSLDDEYVDQFDSVNLNLTSQIIDSEHYSYEERGIYILADEDYVQYEPDKVELDEITNFFFIPTTSNPEKPVWIFEFEYSGYLDVDIRIEYDKAIFVPPQGHENPRTIWDWYIQKNEETPIEFSYVNAIYNDASVYNNWGIFNPGDDIVNTAIATYISTIEIAKGDIIRVYLNRDSVSNVSIAIWGTDGIHIDQTGAESLFATSERPSGMVDIPTYFRFKQHSTYPETNAFSFLVHDAGGQIIDRYTSEPQSFYSEYLGSDRTLYRQYDGDGCGWKYAISKGLQIRQYSLIEKPFFLSFNQWWKGINPVLCLGLGYEIINSLPVIRVEQMEHFYDASSVSVNISNVQQISRSYDQEVIFKTVKVGYSQWQSEDISGIDDAQTKHTYATRLQKSGTDLTIESEFIAASLAIETTRRTTKIKSADYKFDNNTFLIAINPIPVDVSPETSPDVNDYTPELDENFTSITNLLNSDTRYNSRITPSRNLMRWIRYISGALQSYIDSKFKFVSGEGNYDMTSDMSNVSDGCDEIRPLISEKQDLPISNDPLHLSLSYDIVVPMEWEDYLLIRENRKKAIGISQTATNHVKFFIDTLEYELVKSRATIKAWPVEFFDIEVIEITSNQNVCYSVPGECSDAYLTEDGFEFETEDGNCLILN